MTGSAINRIAVDLIKDRRFEDCAKGLTVSQWGAPVAGLSSKDIAMVATFRGRNRLSPPFNRTKLSVILRLG
jgi:hypothetical protein